MAMWEGRTFTAHYQALVADRRGKRRSATVEGIRADTPRDVILAAIKACPFPSAMYIESLVLHGPDLEPRPVWINQKKKSDRQCWLKDQLPFAFK